MYYKDNLIRRGCIQVDLGLCTSGCGQEESAYHLFVGCGFLKYYDVFFVNG